MNLTFTGTQGAPGVSDVNPGGIGTAGGTGLSLSETLASGPGNTDTSSTLSVTGGEGGGGGEGGAGGAGGAGGDGGDAIAIVSTSVADSSSASATANGGAGQVGGSASGGDRRAGRCCRDGNIERHDHLEPGQRGNHRGHIHRDRRYRR